MPIFEPAFESLEVYAFCRWEYGSFTRTLINCLNIGSQRANKRRENDLESKKHPLTLRRHHADPASYLRMSVDALLKF